MRLPRLFGGEIPTLRRWFEELQLPDAGEPLTPDIDMIERNGEIIVTAEVPGVALEDLEVTATPDRLTIKGEKKTEKKEEGEGVYRAERTYGAFLRTIALPVEIVPEAVEAKLEKGVLRIVLPKVEEAKAQKVEVKGGEEAAEKKVVTAK